MGGEAKKKKEKKERFLLQMKRERESHIVEQQSVIDLFL